MDSVFAADAIKCMSALWLFASQLSVWLVESAFLSHRNQIAKKDSETQCTDRQTRRDESP